MLLLFAVFLQFTPVRLLERPETGRACSGRPGTGPGVALFARTDVPGQLWLFWAAPLVGAAIGAAIWRFVLMPGESLENPGGESGI